jgi:hypothetical protein
MYKVRSARASRRKLSAARFARVTAIGTHPNPAGSSVLASNEPVAEHHHIKANPVANGTFWDGPLTRRRNNRTVESLKGYTEVGILHQQPCGQTVFRTAEPFVPDVPCQKGRRQRAPFPHTALVSTASTFTQGSRCVVLHAILVDGIIERIEGTPELAEAAVWKQRKAGHRSEYLFAARTELEFERKRALSPLLQRQCASAH